MPETTEAAKTEAAKTEEAKAETPKKEAKKEVKTAAKIPAVQPVTTTAKRTAQKKFATASIKQARISFKQSVVLANRIKGKRLASAKKWLEGLVEGRISVEANGRKSGKKFPTTAAKFLEAVQSLEANAKVKNMNVEKLFLVKAHATQGETFYRPKSRFKLRGRQAKSANFTLVAAER